MRVHVYTHIHIYLYIYINRQIDTHICIYIPFHRDGNGQSSASRATEGLKPTEETVPTASGILTKEMMMAKMAVRDERLHRYYVV